MLSILADLGEFIGGVAVIITIVYFAVQLNANLKANRAQALSTWTMAAQAEKEVLYRDPNFSRLYREILFENKSPEGDEKIQFYAYCIQFMNTWQLAFTQEKLGITSSHFLERVSVGYISFASNPHVQRWWLNSGAQMYDQEFVNYVNAKTNAGV